MPRNSNTPKVVSKPVMGFARIPALPSSRGIGEIHDAKSKSPVLKPRSNRSRRGVALISVLVCMGVAMTILLAVVQKSLSCRRQIQNEARLEQARWLVDAGVRKAIAELERRPDYGGEQISFSNSVNKFGVANVEIKTQRTKSFPNQIRVIVSAELGDKDDEVLKTRRTKELVFDVPSLQER